MNDLALANVQEATICVERALEQLQKARTLDEVNDIRDYHDALHFLSRRRKASTAAGADCWLIARNAERRIGQMTGGLDTAPGARTDLIEPGHDAGPGTKKATLKTFGITKQKANDFEAYAKLDDGDWNARLQAIHENVLAGKPPSNPLSYGVTDYDGDAWESPDSYLDADREVLGVIGLDPASNEQAQKRVQALTYFTKEDDGLARQWLTPPQARTVRLNPPYSDPWCGMFSDRFFEQHALHYYDAGILLVNACIGTKWFDRALERCTVWCAPRKRVPFIDPKTGKPVKGNRQGQAVLYVGDKPQLFADVYARFGSIQQKFAA